MHSSRPSFSHQSCAAFILLLLASVALGAAEERATSIAEPAELVVWNRPLMVFRAPFGGLTTSERARRAEERIAALPAEALAAEIEAKDVTMAGQTGVMFYADGRPLFGITPGDVDGSDGQTLAQAAELTRAGIREVFAARVEAMRPQMMLSGALHTVLTALILAMVLITLVRLSRKLQSRVRESAFSQLPTFFGVDLRPVAVSVVRNIIRLPLVALGLAAIHLSLTYALGQFPYTRPWSNALGTWFLSLAKHIALGVIEALPGMVMVIIIFILTRIVTRGLNAFCTSVEEGRLEVSWMQPETAKATKRMAAVLVWLFAITIAYPYFPGSSSDAFKGVSVFAGLMLTLGSAGMVNQVMSGLVVVFSRTMRPGDIVKVGEVVGTVTDLGFLSTKVRTPRHEEVTIPNAVLVGTSVTNFSRTYDDFGMVVSTAVTIGYDTPWRQVHAMLQLAATRTAGLRAEPGPEVVQKALSDWYVEYELRVRLEKPEDRFAALSRLHAMIQDVFNEHGVQIMSPHFETQPAQAVVIPKSGWAPAPALPLT